MFLIPFFTTQEKVFEGLLTNAYSALTLSRHPKKRREGEMDHFYNEPLAKPMRVHNFGSHILPCA